MHEVLTSGENDMTFGWIEFIIIIIIIIIVIVIIIIIMAVQPLVGPWPLFQFLDLLHSQ
jgi:hypothetical protein